MDSRLVKGGQDAGGETEPVRSKEERKRMSAQPSTGKASDLVQQWLLGRRPRVHVPTVF